MFWVILHNRTEEKSEQRAHRKEKISEDSQKHDIICEETKGVPDKQRFLAFAAMHELTRRDTQKGNGKWKRKEVFWIEQFTG